MDSNHRPHAYQACALTSWAITPKAYVKLSLLYVLWLCMFLFVILYIYYVICLILKVIWQPPTFPRRLQRSIIGRISLNHRVRDENGCVPYTHRHQKYLIMFKQSCFKSVRASLVSNSTRFAALVWINPSYASNPLFIHLWKQAFNIHSQSIIRALTHCMQHWWLNSKTTFTSSFP